MSLNRRAELGENLAAVRARIAAACDACGRDAAEVTLIAVTKGFPASDVEHLAALGVRDVGENKDQEAVAKVAACAAVGLGTQLRWHFLGQLQTNKARSLLGWARVVHSLDRPRAVGALAAAATRAGRTMGALVQVDLDPAADARAAQAGQQGAGQQGAGQQGAGQQGAGQQGAGQQGAGQDRGRGGAAPADVPALAAAVASAEGLRLLGLMAVAPRGVPAGPAFARLAEVAAAVRADFPGAYWLSAGMTADLEDAVRSGATHVRVGSALLGPRASLG